MDRWPHQLRGVRDTLAALETCQRVCLTAPTGGGKTVMVQDIAQAYLAVGHRVALYSNRKMMIDQLSESLQAAGIYHGVRAAGWEDEREHPFQVCSFQTETSRVLKRNQMDLHACGQGDLAIIDEGHLHRGPKAQEIRRRHIEGGAATLDVTATPLGMAEVSDQLVIAGTNSELHACGALVPADHYGCDEPDLRAFKKLREGEDPSVTVQKKAMMTPSIMGRVWQWFNQLNPDRTPTVLFAPGVEESIWFAENFTKAGVRAAHIDGDDVWLDGEFRPSESGLREQIREEHRDGLIKVVCNRFVLREGVDWPWISHMILAFIAGSLQTYIQVGGRGLRAYPGKERLVVQDHGGQWHRFGSLNADRQWALEYTDAVVCGLRADRLRAKKETEPFTCPQCGRVWQQGKVCAPARGGCGFALDCRKKARPVVSTDGELKYMAGDIYRPRRVSRDPRGAELWKRMYFRSRTDTGARTFRAAEALFAQENHWGWPDRAWPYMPTEPLDFFRLVGDVPLERLIQEEIPVEG